MTQFVQYEPYRAIFDLSLKEKQRRKNKQTQKPK